MLNVRTKGQTGEREAAALVGEWAKPVTDAIGCGPVTLTRNLVQSRQGGYDLVGLDWLALEVKRHETLQLNQWWSQTLRQAGPGQLPVLMYRKNRTPWRFRALVTTAHYGPIASAACPGITVDMDVEAARLWFQTELWVRLTERR